VSKWDVPWSPEEDAKLTGLWDEGLSVKKISVRLSPRTSHAVVGRAHRLNLPVRPSPIKRDGKPKPIGRPKTGGPTLPVLDSLPVLEVTLPKRLRSPCCWPMEACEEMAELGRPYCHAHSAAAYVQTGRQLISCEAVA
jgi:GcrA cell cycle regulator